MSGLRCLPAVQADWPPAAFGAELPQALRWLTSPHLALAMQREDARWKAEGAPPLDLPSIHAEAFLSAFNRLADDLLERLGTGEIIAWARQGDPLGAWAAVPVGHWSVLRVTSWVSGAIEGQESRLFGARVWPAAGLPTDLAAQVSGPLAVGDDLDRGNGLARATLDERFSGLLRAGAMVTVGAQTVFPAAYVPQPIEINLAVARRRGPAATKMRTAADRMLADLKTAKQSVAKLRAMKQESIADIYGLGSRETAMKALELAVSEFQNGNSDK